MKKLFSPLLPVVLAFIVASCGGSDSETSSGTTEPKAPTSGSNARVLVVGDSICTGYGQTTGYGRRLASKGFNVVAQQCQDGREAPDVAGAVGGWTSQTSATHVIILLGTNDAIRGSLSNAASALSRMANAVNAQGAVAIIGTLPPMTRNSGWNARAAQLSGSIRGIGGARIADIRARFTGAHLVDGIHPNESGQALIADIFAQQIR